MNQRTIKTKLIGKQELFSVLALGEACKLPVLLLGEPGVGKTQALLDYAAAKYDYNIAQVREHTFVIELDEGTKTSEIKGRVNMKSLLEDKEYKIEAPIANSKFILINEVDKGTSGVRNTLLSVMRERALFYGKEIKKCDWDIFTGSCNMITEDEIDNPFWDRFVLTTKIERIGSDKMKSLIQAGMVQQTIHLNIPSLEEIHKQTLDKNHLNKFIDVIYSEVSDRTCSFVSLITKAIKIIYKTSEDVEAIMKACELLAPSKLSAVAAKLESKRESMVRTNINSLAGVIKGDNDAYTQSFLTTILTELDQMSDMNTYKNKSLMLADELFIVIDGLDDHDCSNEFKQTLLQTVKGKLVKKTIFTDSKGQGVITRYTDSLCNLKEVIDQEKSANEETEETEESDDITGSQGTHDWE